MHFLKSKTKKLQLKLKASFSASQPRTVPEVQTVTEGRDYSEDQGYPRLTETGTYLSN